MKTKSTTKAKKPEPTKADTKNAKVSKSTQEKNLSADFEQLPSSDEEDDSEEEEEEEEGEEGEFEGFESTDDEEDETEDNKSKEKKTKGTVDEEKIKDTISKKKSSGKNEKPGVVYVGRIPHGFYEDQMKSYFSQFGDISRLRLSRNKKTGKSKHYAFIEFQSQEIAKIVAESMDNYLLFGHLLKVKVMEPEQIHENLFDGANKTFKPVPWARISRLNNDKRKSKTALEELQTKHEQRIKEKNEKLASLGINYSYELGNNHDKNRKSKDEKKKTTKKKKSKN